MLAVVVVVVCDIINIHPHTHTPTHLYVHTPDVFHHDASHPPTHIYTYPHYMLISRNHTPLCILRNSIGVKFNVEYRCRIHVVLDHTGA